MYIILFIESSKDLSNLRCLWDIWLHCGDIWLHCLKPCTHRLSVTTRASLNLNSTIFFLYLTTGTMCLLVINWFLFFRSYNLHPSRVYTDSCGRNNISLVSNWSLISYLIVTNRVFTSCFSGDIQLTDERDLKSTSVRGCEQEQPSWLLGLREPPDWLGVSPGRGMDRDGGAGGAWDGV